MIDHARHTLSLEQFVSTYKKKTWVVGICVLGSYIRREMTPHSDIDVYILTKKAPYNAIGSTTIDRTHIEYFIFPLESKLEQVQAERGTVRLETGIFSEAVPLYDPHGKAATLVLAAQKQARAKTKRKTRDESTRFRYLMRECQLDAQDCAYDNKPLAFHNIASKIIDACTDAVYQKKGKTLPAAKKLDTHLHKTDHSFAHLLRIFYQSERLFEKARALENITNYASSLYGRPVTDYEIKIEP